MTDKMKKYRLFPAICLAAALLLSACSQDELTENSTTLPEGEYPLQIGSVTLTAEVSEQPWTRVAESTDGMSSEFKAGDAIGVSLNGETATYTYDGTAWTSEAPLYWKDKQPATVTAWYPVDEEIDFTQQDEGLTYLLKGTSNADADYDTPANLTFAHQLAKVRVVLEGTKATEVQQVYVRSYPKSVNNQGDLGETTGGDPIYVPMMEATYNGQQCWEANLRKGYLDANNSFQVANADGVRVQVTQDRVDIKAGHVHTIKVNVGEAQQVTGEISDNDTYIVSGTREEPVNITGGSPTIYLKDANINVSDGPAINITSGNPTIHVFGGNNIVSSNKGAGIYVAEGCTVTIQGSSRKDDVLKATAGEDGAGIGCSGDYDTDMFPCGNIVIKNVTVYAYSDASIISSPGIGSRESCGTITIDNATVYARGTAQASSGCPAIGSYSSVPTITINGSDIYAYRGAFNGTSYADWIGRGGRSSYPGGQIQGDIRSTTVYKGKWDWSVEVSEGVVVYGADGISKEQVQ